jgi:hypothetical protein
MPSYSFVPCLWIQATTDEKYLEKIVSEHDHVYIYIYQTCFQQWDCLRGQVAEERGKENDSE